MQSSMPVNCVAGMKRAGKTPSVHGLTGNGVRVKWVRDQVTGSVKPVDKTQALLQGACQAPPIVRWPEFAEVACIGKSVDIRL